MGNVSENICESILGACFIAGYIGLKAKMYIYSSRFASFVGKQGPLNPDDVKSILVM